MSKNKKTTPTVGSKIELVTVSSAPRRDNFSVADWRKAMKEAENVLYPSRVRLLDIYNDIELDTHLTSVIGKRRDAIGATKITFKSTSGKPNEKVDELIDTPWFREMLGDILDAKFYGHSALWLDLSGGEFVKYELLKRKHILPQRDLYITKQTDKEGINYSQPPYSNYVITAGKKDDFGLLIKSVVWVLFKRGDISDWATFNEVFAMPFRLAKYPQYDEVAKKALADALNSSGSMQSMLIPDTTNLDFIQNATSGSTTGYLQFAEFCDKQLSKAFLHNTLTTDAEGGQYKGQTHENSEQTVITADRQYVLDVLNTNLRKILEIHGFDAQGKFVCIEEDHISLMDRVVIDEKVANHIEIPAEYWHTKYGIPIPKGGAKAKIQAQSSQQLSLEDRVTSLTEQLADMQKLDAKPRPHSFFD